MTLEYDVRIDPCDRARSIRELVMSEAAESERLRTMSPAVVEAMWASGLMAAFNPADRGRQPSRRSREMIETWIEMAWQDGSFGWTGIANLPSSFAAAAYLPDEGFAEVFAANDNRVTMGGQFAPNGQGVVVDGGYRLTGAWNFGSGTGHSEYVAAGFIPMEDGAAAHARRWHPEVDGRVPAARRGHVHRRLARPGAQGHRLLRLQRRRDVRTGVSGLRTVHARTPPRQLAAGRMGMMPVTAAGHAAWALGVAKSMLDDVQELAATKYRMSDVGESLASRPTFQKGLAHHVAMWRAARLLVIDTFSDRRGRRWPRARS